MPMIIFLLVVIAVGVLLLSDVGRAILRAILTIGLWLLLLAMAALLVAGVWYLLTNFGKEVLKALQLAFLGVLWFFISYGTCGTIWSMIKPRISKGSLQATSQHEKMVLRLMAGGAAIAFMVFFITHP